MGKMRVGYGSEFHLLRWMGRHRTELNQRVARAIGRPDAAIHWLDFNTSLNPKTDKEGNLDYDHEWLGLDMLDHDKELQRAWRAFWPTEHGIHNWDAVGWVGDELLLVEAKAHAGEIISDSHATAPASVNKIKDAFQEIQRGLGVVQCSDWMRQYYQFTNRLATLYFLDKHQVPARLLFIYFLGDKPTKGREDCPKTEDEWKEALRAQDGRVALPKDHALADRIHKLFLPVSAK